MNHFIVTGNKKTGHFSTFRLGIACKTIDDALRITRKKYGNDVQIMNVTHQGPLEVLETT